MSQEWKDVYSCEQIQPEELSRLADDLNTAKARAVYPIVHKMVVDGLTEMKELHFDIFEHDGKTFINALASVR